jgi:hypothetical protein
MARGEYSIIRYVPQPEREESVNLGVVLVSGAQGALWTLFRDASSFIEYPPYLRPNDEVIHSFENQLKHIPQQTGQKELSTILGDLRHDLQNSIQATQPKACEFGDPKEFLQSIFELLVAPPSGESSRPIRKGAK